MYEGSSLVEHSESCSIILDPFSILSVNLVVDYHLDLR